MADVDREDRLEVLGRGVDTPRPCPAVKARCELHLLVLGKAIIGLDAFR